MRKLCTLLFFCLFAAGVASARPHPQKASAVKRHALAVAASGVETVATHPKATLKLTLKGIAKSLGVGVRVLEGGVDVVHLATAAIAGPKPSPFYYANEVVGAADAGLEKLYLVFWNANI